MPSRRGVNQWTWQSLALLYVVVGLAALAFSSCASTSVTPTGSQRYDPLPATHDVVVFATPSEVKEPFETLGIISHTDPGKYQILTIGDAIPALKEKARSIGANAIIDQATPVKSGIISTGITVTARAIRIQRQ